MNFKYMSLCVLTLQNSALSVIMHYSRTRGAAHGKLYSAASAVFLSELIKFAISLAVAAYNIYTGAAASHYTLPPSPVHLPQIPKSNSTKRLSAMSMWTARTLCRSVFVWDCWKLSVPAIIYVVQNNLQFVAASNLNVATFQVSYNLKILTTALFSVLLLHKRLSRKKWAALVLLALGVATVQIQTAQDSPKGHSSERVLPSPWKGLAAVGVACITSGLAGVYFEMVLKGSKVDLWIRNIQLSVFSLPPAAFPVLYPHIAHLFSHADPAPQPILAHFGFWPWFVVLIQVLGGLVTALVIKYADNIMKGFATSLAVVLSCLVGFAFFNVPMSFGFLVGAAAVVASTLVYNLPEHSLDSAVDSIANIVSSSPQLKHSPEKSSPFSSYPIPAHLSNTHTPPQDASPFSTPIVRRSARLKRAATPDASPVALGRTLPLNDPLNDEPSTSRQQRPSVPVRASTTDSAFLSRTSKTATPNTPVIDTQRPALNPAVSSSYLAPNSPNTTTPAGAPPPHIRRRSGSVVLPESYN